MLPHSKRLEITLESVVWDLLDEQVSEGEIVLLVARSVEYYFNQYKFTKKDELRD